MLGFIFHSPFFIGVFFRMVLQETYELTDTVVYKPTEISQPAQGNGDHSWLLDNDLTIDLPTNCEITFKVKTTSCCSRFGIYSKSQITSSVSNYGFGESNSSSEIGAFYRATTSQGWGTNESSPTSYHSFKFVKEGTTITAYVDDNSKGSQTFSWIGNYSDYTFGFWTWGTGTITVKDIMVKAL